MASKLQLKNISFKIEDKFILKDINITFDNGIYALLGLNGSGKTSLLNIISTIIKPSTGEILYNSNDITADYREIRTDLGYMSQNTTLLQDLSITQNLYYFGLLKGCDSTSLKEKVRSLLSNFNLESIKNMKIRNLSGGVRQKVGIAIALINSPKLIILDEPINNLDKYERKNLYQLLSILSEESIIIISTHLIDEIKLYCHNITFMNSGQINFHGSTLEAIQNMEAKNVYETDSDSLLKFYS